MLSYTVGGSIGMGDYLEAGTIVFLFTLADWLESRSTDKVCPLESRPHDLVVHADSTFVERLLSNVKYSSYLVNTVLFIII